MKNIEQILTGEISEGIERINTTKDKGGFFDLPKEFEPCLHPSHKPPSHMVIPQGQGYKHVCPSCGKVSIIIPTQITL